MRDPGAHDHAARAVEEAILGRRTHKVFQSEPVDRETLTEILELARWAPNHKLTNPWRFRVIGPKAREALKRVAEAHRPGSASKLDRAPTLVCATVRVDGEQETRRREDLLASAAACYIVLLAAHSRGLASYWRTLAEIDTPEGRRALSIPDEESPIGLLHLGYPRQPQRPPERAPVQSVVSFLE